MKAIYYVRVSTGSQSVERQIDDIKQYCLKEEIELLDTDFRETESGKLRERPVLTEMETYIEKNHENFDFVIIHELSRLGRTSKVLETIDNLHSKKIGLISLKEKITTLDKDKKINHSSSLIISILTSINGYELETTKYRSISGIESSMRAGKANGSLNFPYGYMKDENKKLVKNPEETGTIELIFKMCLEGKGTKLIADELNKLGTLTRTKKLVKEYKYGKKWVDGTIYSILKNPLYTGQRRRATKEFETIKNKNGKEVKREIFELLPFPDLKIIEPDVFEKVQNILSSNYNKLDKHTKYEYLLEPKKIFCGCCAKRNIVRHYFPHKRQDLHDNRYMCLSKRYKDQCENVGINIDKLEYTIQQIILFMFEDKLLEKLDDKTLKKQIQDIIDEISDLRKELEKVSKNKLNLVRQVNNEELDQDEYLLLLNEDKNKIQQLSNKIDLKYIIKNDLSDTYENIKDIKKMKTNFLTGTKIPKDIVNKIINKITITKQDIYPEIFKNKQDKVIELKILSGAIEYKFLISHREKYIYYCNHGYDGFLIDKFINEEEMFDKKLFEFLTY